MRPSPVALVVLACLIFFENSIIEAQEFTRTELGISSSVLPNNRLGATTDAGLGGRFTYNLGPSLALEAETSYYFTGIGQRGALTGGRAISVLAGPKAGIRRRKFGIFFKSRLGILTFSDVFNTAALFDGHSASRRTHAVMDLGGVVELYPAERLALRLDVGQLLVRYGDATDQVFPLANGLSASLRTNGFVVSPVHISVGASYRLGSLQTEPETFTGPSRFQFGIQYSLQTLQRSAFVVRDESAVGGWVTYNLGRYFAVDAAANFFPRKDLFVDFLQGGQMIQAFAGVRWGIRRDHWGVFAKLRPGTQIYTLTSGFDFRNVLDPHQDLPSFAHFALDAGGIFEIYTSKHTLLRFDAGNTTIYFRSRNFLDGNGAPFTVSGATHASIQMTGGFGLRF